MKGIPAELRVVLGEAKKPCAFFLCFVLFFDNPFRDAYLGGDLAEVQLRMLLLKMFENSNQYFRWSLGRAFDRAAENINVCRNPLIRIE